MKAWKKILIGFILVCVWLLLPVFPPFCWLSYAMQGVIVIIGAGLIAMIIMRIQEEGMSKKKASDIMFQTIKLGKEAIKSLENSIKELKEWDEFVQRYIDNKKKKEK